MSTLLQIIIYTLGFYVLCVAFMYYSQGSFIFFPTSDLHSDHREKYVENVTIQSGSVSLGGWLVNPRLAREKLIIYYGGNAEDIFQNIDEYRDIQAASLFVAYRGYGPSSGKPGQKELFEDSLAVVDEMVGRYKPDQLFLVGRSLGSGVACYVASQRDVQGVVLITPYDSIVNVARQRFWWLPVGLLLRHRFTSTDYVSLIPCPILILYGGLDLVVLPERTKNLLHHIKGEKDIQFLERADHSSIDMFPEYWESILRFINQ